MAKRRLKHLWITILRFLILERFAKSAGYTFAVAESDGIYTVSLNKDKNADVAAAENGETFAIFVTEKQLGSAQNELGTNLIRMYFYTLTQMDKLPKIIALMNEGVLLACQDEQIIENLKTLIEHGTKVMVCGTCLNFYDMRESLGCGTISNMYEILEAIAACTKVMKI